MVFNGMGKLSLSNFFVRPETTNLINIDKKHESGGHTAQNSVSHFLRKRTFNIQINQFEAVVSVGYRNISQPCILCKNKTVYDGILITLYTAISGSK